MLPWIGQPLLLTEPRGFPFSFSFGRFRRFFCVLLQRKLECPHHLSPLSHQSEALFHQPDTLSATPLLQPRPEQHQELPGKRLL